MDSKNYSSSQSSWAIVPSGKAGSGELGAALDELRADPVTARLGIDEEQAKLCDLVGAPHAVDGANALPIEVRHPGGLQFGVRVFEIAGRSSR
jgi:hypothetical protein